MATKTRKKDNVMIRIRTERFDSGENLFDSDVLMNPDAGIPDEFIDDGKHKNEPEKIEIFSAGELKQKDGRVILAYEESELTGMEGSRTEISFATDAPGLVTMYRSGSVTTSLVFESGRRHHCVYETPLMPFDVCVHTIAVRNTVMSDGRLELDYMIEIRGAKTEHCKMSLTVHDNAKTPSSYL